MSAVRVRITVKPPFRNNGNSWGLEYPIIYGLIPQIGWSAWDRRTGEVKFISSNSNQILAADEVRRFSEPHGYSAASPFINDSIP